MLTPEEMQELEALRQQAAADLAASQEAAARLAETVQAAQAGAGR